MGSIDILSTIVDPEAVATATEYDDVLRRRTARGSDETMLYGFLFYSDESEEPLPVTSATPKAILQEGVLSIMQAVALLTADKVPGYEDPIALLRDMVEQGIIERFTRKLPMGYVGPHTLIGTYHQAPLEVIDENLQFTTEFVADLQTKRDKHVANALMSLKTIHTLSPEAREDFFEGPLGIMCPAAGKDGGVRSFANTLLALS